MYADLVPREVAEAWLAYLREEVPAVAFKCSTQKQATNLGRRPIGQSTGGTFQGSDCLGEAWLRWVALRCAGWPCAALSLKTAACTHVLPPPPRWHRLAGSPRRHSPPLACS
jgi:hypothetical protein